MEAGKLLELMGMGCGREVSLAQYTDVCLYSSAHTSAWVCGRWPWDYGGALSIIIIMILKVMHSLVFSAIMLLQLYDSLFVTEYSIR